MAKTTVSVDEFYKAVKDNKFGELITRKTQRPEGPAISPSAAARVVKYKDKTTGSWKETIVLLDAIQHQKECQELVKKGIIPLRRGYIFIDREAYTELTQQGLVTNAIPIDEVKFNISSVQSEKKDSTGMKTVIYDNTDLKLTKEARENDAFYKKLSGATPQHVIYRPANINAIVKDAVKEVDNYILNNTSRGPINFSPGKPTYIHVYYSSLNSWAPGSDSVLFIVPIVNVQGQTNISAEVTRDNFEYFYSPVYKTKKDKEFPGLQRLDSKFIETPIRRDLSDTQAAGHLKSFKTGSTEDFIAALKVLKKEQEFINHPDYNEYGNKIDVMIEVLEDDVQNMLQVDKFFGNPASYFHPDINQHFNNIISGAHQLGKNVTFTEMTKKGLKTIKGSALIEKIFTITGISTVESFIINSGLKADATKRAIVSRINTAWDRASKIYAERAAKESLPNAIPEESSLSVLQALLITALEEIFNTASSKKNLAKRKENYYQFNLAYQAVKKLKFSPFTKKVKPIIRFKTVNNRGFSRRIQQTTLNIVPLINAELKRYVIEQMGYPSLENRSGRFASSVRVLSAQENAAVQYTYQKSPYQVFSPSRGRRPWATEDRDPAKIIDRAIKKLGQDRFQKVFRTEET